MPDSQTNKLNPMLLRFLQFLDTKGVSYRKAEDILLVGNGRLGKMRDNGTELKKSLLENILHSYPEVNREWLLTGQDPMVTSANEILNLQNQPYHEPPTNYMQQISEFLNKDRTNDSQIEITPVYNKHVTSEKVSGLNTEHVIPDVLLLNGAFKDCDLVIRHTDPAMNGFMKKNSFIGIKQITRESYTEMIIPGKSYVVVLKNYVIERFLHPGVEKDLLLRSVDRDLNPDFEITFDQVIELWLIKAWIPVFEAEPV